jgi:hypothetical protein
MDTRLRTVPRALAPAAGTLHQAIQHAGQIGAVPAWAVPLLLELIGRPVNPAEAWVLCHCIAVAINAGLIRTMEAERAARCLGGWQ